MTRKYVMPALVGLTIIVIGLIFLSRGRTQSAESSLVDRCSQLDGEWLYQSDDQICLMASGVRLAYSQAADEFLMAAIDQDSGLIAPVSEVALEVDQVCQAVGQELDFIDLPVPISQQVQVDHPRVDFSTNEAARLYRTAISKDVARGVNYAGKFVVSTWGCGKGCVGSAVIDATDGFIASYGLKASSYGYRPDSFLLKAGSENYIIDLRAVSSTLVPWQEVCSVGDHD